MRGDRVCLWKTPKIPTPSVTARELTPSTEAADPSMGGRICGSRNEEVLRHCRSGEEQKV